MGSQLAIVTVLDELNRLAADDRDPMLKRIRRDGHCHEAVMWYVVHRQHLECAFPFPPLALDDFKVNLYSISPHHTKMQGWIWIKFVWLGETQVEAHLSSLLRACKPLGAENSRLNISCVGSTQL